MSKRLKKLIQNQPQVKVVARAYSGQEDNSVWFAIAAALFAVAFYFISFFFGFTGGGRALTQS